MDKSKDHEKLAYAAFYKDISLVDKPELAKITTFKELEEAEQADARDSHESDAQE
jgi:hypothetical protein